MAKSKKTSYDDDDDDDDSYDANWSPGMEQAPAAVDRPAPSVEPYMHAPTTNLSDSGQGARPQANFPTNSQQPNNTVSFTLDNVHDDAGEGDPYADTYQRPAYANSYSRENVIAEEEKKRQA